MNGLYTPNKVLKFQKKRELLLHVNMCPGFGNSNYQDVKGLPSFDEGACIFSSSFPFIWKFSALGFQAKHWCFDSWLCEGHSLQMSLLLRLKWDMYVHLLRVPSPWVRWKNPCQFMHRAGFLLLLPTENQRLAECSWPRILQLGLLTVQPNRVLRDHNRSFYETGNWDLAGVPDSSVVAQWLCCNTELADWPSFLSKCTFTGSSFWPRNKQFTFHTWKF